MTISMITSDVILPFQALGKEQKETLFYRLPHCLRHPVLSTRLLSSEGWKRTSYCQRSEIRSCKLVSPSVSTIAKSYSFAGLINTLVL